MTGPPSFDPWLPRDGQTLSPDVTQPIDRHLIPPRATALSLPGSWTFVDVLAGLGIFLLLTIGLNFLAGVVLGLTGPPATWLGGFLPVWLGLFGTCVWACRRHGTGKLAVDLGLRFRAVDLAIGLGAGIGLRIASGVIALVVQSFGHPLSSNVQTILGDSRGVWLVVNLVLATSLIAPFVEEVFFRGLVLRSGVSSLHRRRPATTPEAAARQRLWAMAGSALLFAVIHLSEISDVQTAVVLFLTLVLVGFSNAALVFKTGRLGSAIVTHVVFNGITAVVLLAR